MMTDAEAKQLLLAPSIGRGGARETFHVQGDPSVVMKKMQLPFPGANILEWQLWNAVSKTRLADCFGKCFAISETGRYLIMEYLEDITEDDYANVPDTPIWLNDRKASAFGKTKAGVVKIRDYASVDLERVLDGKTEPVPFAINVKLRAKLGRD